MNRIWSAAAGILLTVWNPLNAEVLFHMESNPADVLSGFSKEKNIRIENNGVFGTFEKRVNFKSITLKLNPERYSGRFLVLSCEARGEKLLPKKKYFDGIKLMLSMENSNRKTWGEISFPSGNFDWKPFQTYVAVPENLKKINLSIGLQNSAGIFALRKVKIESIGVPVPIRQAANMALKDEVAGDNRGGWTDQGPKQDGRDFFGSLFRRDYSGIPFDTEPRGKGVLTMGSKYFTAGPAEVTIPLKPVRKARSFYLLHTMAWGPTLKKDRKVGSVTLTDKNGRKQRIEVIYNRDVADWYRNIAVLPNGYAALRGRSGDNEVIGVYLSKFDLEKEMDGIREVKIESVPDGLWLILGATLLEKNIPLPTVNTFRIQQGKQWLPITRSPRNQILPGSALDLSPYMRKGSVDELGRIVIRDGHFVFEKNPSMPVRFMTDAVTPNVDFGSLSHADLDLLAQEMRRNGYNMVRTHFLDSSLMSKSVKNLEFNPKMLDSIDYFIACMKKYGIYLNFDCMTSWTGYTVGNPRKMQNNLKSFKSLIYHDRSVRDNWRKGVEKFLCRVNPYTKTRLIDDPVLVMAVAFNEHEFGFWREFEESFFLEKWRTFLKKKYGSIDHLHAAWGKDSVKFKTFGEIPCMKGYLRNYRDADALEFLLPYEKEMTSWFQTQMRELGFKGVLTAYNCGKNQYFNYLRKDLPAVAMNHYYAHPSSWVSKHSFINQRSCIEEFAVTFRNFIGARLFDKPFVVTEQNFSFWNQYRYEQGFVIGGYAAFQGFDALTCHGSPISFRKVNDIQTFGIWMDPIAKASEFLTYFLFVRGDVAPAKNGVRIRVLKKDVFGGGGLSTEQSLPALLARESLEIADTPSEFRPTLPGEITYRLGATNSVIVDNAGFSSTTDNPAANVGELMKHFRSAGILPPENKTDGKSVFETCTGELYLDASKKFMSINTPRLQGICAQAGTSFVLPDLIVEQMTSDGNLALVSVDGLKRIAESRRMVLVYATNALNSNMEFSSREMITLLDNGRGPTLLRRGAFTVGIRNRNAASLKLYPLDLSGKRLKCLNPVRVGDGIAYFSVDTGRDGSSIFFEISE